MSSAEQHKEDGESPLAPRRQRIEQYFDPTNPLAHSPRSEDIAQLCDADLFTIRSHLCMPSTPSCICLRRRIASFMPHVSTHRSYASCYFDVAENGTRADLQGTRGSSGGRADSEKALRSRKAPGSGNISGEGRRRNSGRVRDLGIVQGVSIAPARSFAPLSFRIELTMGKRVQVMILCCFSRCQWR